MAKKRRGRLSEDDRALWSKVTAQATPLQDKPKRDSLPPEPPAKPPKTPGKKPVHVAERPSEKPKPPVQPPGPVRMDAKAFGRLRRGKLTPDARIDLHGMTVAAAHTALISFILGARADGRRLVLVITGKDRQGDESRGILRRQVPHWLETPPLAQAILQVETAHQKHGGTGAYYVYLRRRQ